MEGGGAIVVRSAGSRGPADLVAMYDYATWAIQVKRAKPTAAEVEAVRMVSAKTLARWAVVHYNGGLVSLQAFWDGKATKRISPPGLEAE